jgi:hypothetical protein
MGDHRPLFVAVLAALLLVPSAAAKEGVEVVLDEPLPRDAAPGSTGIRGTMTRNGVSTSSDWLFTVAEPPGRPVFPAWAVAAVALGALAGLAAGFRLRPAAASH